MKLENKLVERPFDMKIKISAFLPLEEAAVQFDSKYLEERRIDVFEKSLSRLIQELFKFSNEERPDFEISIPEGYRLMLVKDENH